jgi:mycothiol system anti-sigma-R factor
MNCEEWFERLYQILDKDLDAKVWKELEQHMQDCQPCLDRFELEKRIQERVKQCCKEESCTESIRLRIKAIFKS